MPKTSDASSVTRFRRVASNVIAGPAAKSTSFSPAEQLGVLSAMLQTSSEAQQIFPRTSILGTASWRTPHRQFTRFISRGIEVSAPAPAPAPAPEPAPGPASDITLTAQGNGTRNTFICKYTSSGDTVWATQQAGDTTFGSGFTDTQYGYDVDTDNSGNVYVIGTYTGGFKIYNKSGTTFGTLDNTSGTNDVYIVKYNTTGTAQWVTKISGSLADVGRSIAVTGTGDVYVTGSYISNPVTVFNADGSTFGTLAATGTSTTEYFVVKYNTSGTAQWIARTTGTSNEVGYGVVVDGSGNVYTTGGFSTNPITIYNADTTTFGTLTRAGSSNNDVFIIKYNSSGVVQWATRIASTGNDIGFSIGTDTSGNVYVTGQGGSATVTAYNADTTAFATTLSNVGGGDCFIVKYNTSGVVQWVTKIASTASDIGNMITTDSNANVYVAGQYGAEGYITAYNSDGSTSEYALASSGGTDAFVVKYNSSGTVQWATRINGTGTDIGLGIDTNSSGDIFVSGTYTTGPLTIYNADRSAFNDTFANSGSTNGFLVKYNAAGTAQWVARIYPVISNITLNVGTDDNIYLTGGFTTALSTVTFKLSTPSSTPVVTTYDTLTLANGSTSPATYGDSFVGKYTTAGRLNWAARIGGVDGDITVRTIADVSGNIYVIASTFHLSSSTSQMSVFNANGTTGALLSITTGTAVLIKYSSIGTFQWLLPFSNGVSLGTDSSGNTYILHKTADSSYTINRPGGTVAFTTTFANATGNKSLVARYSATGQPSLIGYIELAQAQNMFVDPTGNSYVVGRISGSTGTPIYNANGSLSLTIPYIDFYVGSFVVKYNSSGVAQWYAQQVSDDTQTSIATTADTSGNVYVLGQYSGNFDMYNSDDTVGFSFAGEFGVNNVFIVKYNSSGIAQWATRIDIQGSSYVRDIVTDSSGNVYIVGKYSGAVGATLYNADGNPSSVTLPLTSGDTVPFIAKYNSSGQAQWALRVGGDSFNSFGSSVAIDTSGNVYFSGGYTDSPLQFYDTSGNVLATPSLANSGSTDYFLAKYNSSGVLSWATRIDGTSAEGYVNFPISTDASNNLIVSGYYTSNPITLRSVGF